MTVSKVTLRISLPRRKAREFEGEEEFPQDYEPQEGDYVIQAEGNIGQHTYVGTQGGRGLGTFKGPDQREDAEKAIREDMEGKKYWPQVWWQDDHGGLTKVSLDKPRRARRTKGSRRLPDARTMTAFDWDKFYGRK